MGELRNLTFWLAPYLPKPSEPSASEVGRNLKAAVPIAFGLLGFVALSVLWRMEVFVVLVAAALCIALWEVAGALLNKRRHIPLLPLWCGILVVVGVTWTRGPLAGLAVYRVVAVAVVLWRWAERWRHPSPWSGDAAAAVFALGWIGLFGSFTVALTGLPRAEWMVVLFIFMLAFSGAGGWAFGVLWGHHPMSPSVSPKRSWEGFAGSLVAAVALPLALVGSALDRPWPVALPIGIAVVLCSTVGGLSESLLKRDLDVKDMGSIFPGHGRMFDRIDSILMRAPVCYTVTTAPFAIWCRWSAMLLTCHALDPWILVFASGSACLLGRPPDVEMPVLRSKTHFLRFGKPISCGKQHDDQVI